MAFWEVSDCEVKATSREALLRTSLSLDTLIATLCFVLGFPLNLFAALLFEVSALHLLELSGKALDLVLVLVDLGLVHVEFGRHCFHLRSFLFEILLIDWKLFSNFGAWLSSEEVLQLDIQLLLFLNDDVFLNNFFSLFNKTFLKSLNLLKHFPSVRIGAFQLSPPVIVQRVFKFFWQCFNRQSLGQKLLVKIDNFVAKVANLGSLRSNDSKLAPQISDAVV